MGNLMVSVTFSTVSSPSFALQKAQLNAGISTPLSSGETSLAMYLVGHGNRWQGKHCISWVRGAVALVTSLQAKDSGVQVSFRPDPKLHPS